MSSLVAKASISSASRSVPRPPLPRLPSGSQLLALEARMLFDGAALATHDFAMDAHRVSDDAKLADQKLVDVRGVGAVDSVSPSKELLVVDANVQGWQQLAAGRAANVDLLVIESGQDGVSAIAAALADKQGYTAIHVVSHGADGQVFLGDRAIDSMTLATRAGEFAIIGQALDREADIVLYGCDLASTRSGMEFLQALARATSADVAASVDKTGAAALGGNWTLEAQVGSIEAKNPISEAELIRFDGLLTNTAGTLELTKTIVQDNVADPPAPGTPTTYTPIYLINNPQPYFRVAGDGSANPTTQTINSALIGPIQTPGTSTGLDADIRNVDAGDFVRVALVLRNTGSSALYNICLNDDVPAGLEIVPGQDNLRVVRGDGTAVQVLDGLNNPATITSLIRSLGGGSTVFHLQDPAGNTQPILTVYDPAANAPGTDVLIITYDARVRSTAQAGSSHISTANVFGYALSEAGAQVPSTAVSDSATVEIASPSINKDLVATNRSFTAGNDVVIGEVVTYEVTLCVPEGVTAGAAFTDTLPAGMMFVNVESITPSAGVSVAGGTPSFSVTPADVNGGFKNQITINFGDITNANTDNSVHDSIKVRYTAVVRDVVSNQSGTTLTNSVAFGSVTDPTLPVLTVVEPAVSINVTSNVTSAAIGACITYTVTINSNGQSPAFDVQLNDALPSTLDFVAGSFNLVSGPAPDQALAFNAGAITGGWNQLAVGTSVQFTFQACINNTAVGGATLDHNADVQFTSLPGNVSGPFTSDPNATRNISSYVSGGGAQERTGVDGVGSALDNYAVRDNAPVTITDSLDAQMFIVESSLSSTGAQNAYSGSGTESDSATVGEVVRYRMVVRVPEANMANFKINAALPDGISFINDGSAALAFVSDNTAGFTSSTLSDAALNKPDGGTPSVPLNVSAIKPNFRIPGGAIQNAGGGALAAGVQTSGADICFALGNVNNGDADSDKEFIVIEFNAVISNAAANQSHDNLNGPVSGPTTLVANFTASYTGDSVLSNDVTETVVEPAITNLVKTVTSPAGVIADPNAPTRITYTVTFTNSGSSTAYDVVVQDQISSIPGLTLVAGSVSGNPPGSTAQTTGNNLQLTIPSLAPNASVTFTYQVDVASGTAFASDPVTVRYTSLENTSGDRLNVSVSQGGTSSTITTLSNQERGSASGQVADTAPGFNNYIDTATVGLGTISGCLWNDATSPNNNVFDSGVDSPLNGVRVELRYAGNDGTIGTADDVVREVLTQTVNGTPGCYVFTGLPAGDYRIMVPTTVNDPGLGTVRNVFDRGVSGAQGDGIILTTLGQGTSRPTQDFVYTRNAPPVAVADTNGTSNTPGATANGNVINPVAPGDRKDTDPESEPIVVCGVAAGSNPGGNPISTGVNTAITGQNNYGTVTIQADGSYVFNVNSANATVSGLASGSTLQEVFSYTICDPAGNKSTTTLTITITGTSVATPSPPDSRDKTFTIPEDLAFPIPVGSILFIDPNPGDSLKAVIIDSLPDPRQGTLLLGTTPVTAGQTITAAQIGSLVFQPVKDVNRSNYPAGLSDPQFTYRVCDQTGLTDPTPNTFKFIIEPVNDNPDPYPPQTRCFDQDAGAQGMNNASEPNQALLPIPTDKEQGAQDLRIVINALPTSGTFSLDGKPLVVNQALTTAEWQRLQFKPDPNFKGPGNGPQTPGAVIDGGKLAFTVSDGKGGEVTSTLSVCIKPNTLKPPLEPPKDPPTVTPEPPPLPKPPELPPLAGPIPPLRQSIDDKIAPLSDLDAGNLFEPNRATGLFGDELLGPMRQTAVADNRAEVLDPSPATGVPKNQAVKRAVADCDAPKPKAKAKPKAVKRMIFSDKISNRTVGFSEQLKDAQKRFKAPAKATVKAVRPDC